VSLTCNNSYVQEKRAVNVLSANFIQPQNLTADSIKCEVNVSIDDHDIRDISITLSKQFMRYTVQ